MDDMSLARLARCWAGSFARIASAKALDAKSASCRSGSRATVVDVDLGRPGVGMDVLPGVGIPDCLGFILEREMSCEHTVPELPNWKSRECYMSPLCATLGQI